MDADLSTGLDAFLPLIAPLLSGHSDLSIGSRLSPGAQVVRSLKREIISRAYNLLLRIIFGSALLRRAVRVQGRPHRSHQRRCYRPSRTIPGFSTPSS